jgi:hydroxymethylglutaryl-CoA lyase
MGVCILSLSDTLGTANPADIKVLFSSLISAYPEIEFGAHLHTDLNGWYAKVDAAYAAGCLRFDSAIMGHGGCPMANDSLVGNLPTERLISYLNKRKVPMQLNTFHFESAYNFSKKIFL